MAPARSPLPRSSSNACWKRSVAFWALRIAVAVKNSNTDNTDIDRRTIPPWPLLELFFKLNAGSIKCDVRTIRTDIEIGQAYDFQPCEDGVAAFGWDLHEQPRVVCVRF